MSSLSDFFFGFVLNKLSARWNVKNTHTVCSTSSGKSQPNLLDIVVKSVVVAEM